MSTLAKIRLRFGRTATEDEGPAVPETGVIANEKDQTTSGTDGAISPNNGHDEPLSEQPEKDLMPTEDAQRGVRKVEAVALTWTKPYLITVFILYVAVSTFVPVDGYANWIF